MTDKLQISETHFFNLVRGLKDSRFGDAEALYRFIFGPPSVRAIFFHLAKWMPKSRRADGSIYKSAAEIARLIGYSQRTIERHRNLLEEMAFDITLRKARGAPTNHFSFNPDRFFAFAGAKLGKSPAEIRALMYPPDGSAQREAEREALEKQLVIRDYVFDSDGNRIGYQEEDGTFIHFSPDEQAQVAAYETAKYEADLRRMTGSLPLNDGGDSVISALNRPAESQNDRPIYGAVKPDQMAETITIPKQANKTQENTVSLNTTTPPPPPKGGVFLDQDLVKEILALAETLKVRPAVVHEWITQYGLNRVKLVVSKAMDNTKIWNPGGWVRMALQKGYQWEPKGTLITPDQLTSRRAMDAYFKQQEQQLNS